MHRKVSEWRNFAKTPAHAAHVVVLVWENANAGGFVEMFVQITNTRGYLKFHIGFHCLPHVLEAAKMFVASHVYCAEQ